MADSTYTHQPATVERDALRLKIPDRGPDHFYLTNRELDFFLAEKGSVLDAAIEAVDVIIGLVADRVKVERGRTLIEEQQKLENWRKRKDELVKEQSGQRRDPRALVFTHTCLNDLVSNDAPGRIKGPVFNLGDWDTKIEEKAGED